MTEQDRYTAASNTLGHLSPALSVGGVSKAFRGRMVLREVSFEVYPGQAVAVVGENGSGKTTLLKVCVGALRADRGTVARVERVAYCPQEPGLIEHLTSDEHVRYVGAGFGLAAEASRAEASTLLSWLRFPANEKATARHLSGGTRQKLSLTLSLMGDAPLILLDEPYQGFDRGTYENFWDHVATWRSQRSAVVVVTHMLGELHRVDKVLELGLDGSWTLNGTEGGIR